MSRTALKKQSSYSQFRKKNSLNKSNLHKSMIDIQNSIGLRADDKTQQITSIQNQLQNLVRNRSLSAKTKANTVGNESFKINISKTLEPQIGPLGKLKKGWQISLNQSQTYQKSARSMNIHTLNQTFEIIEQSEIHNQQDNGFCDPKQQNNKIAAKIKTKNEKFNMQKRKDSTHNIGTASHKQQIKQSLNQLDELQKRLESVKKKKKIDLKDKKIIKPEISTKPLKDEKRIFRSSSEANFLMEANRKRIGREVAKQKETILKPTIKKKTIGWQNETLKDGSAKNQVNSQNNNISMTQIPTKMASIQQKQKLNKQLDRIKQMVMNTQVCVTNLELIRNAIKNMEMLIN